MTYGMALELAPHNITVNCVAPGAIEGDRIDLHSVCSSMFRRALDVAT